MSDGPTPEQLAKERAAIALAQGLDRAIMFAAASFCSQPSPIGAVACVGRRQLLAFAIEDAWRVRQAQKGPRCRTA